MVWYWLFTFEHTLQISLPYFLRSLLQAWRWFAHQLAVFWSHWQYISKSRLVTEWKAYLPTVHINKCHSSGTIHGDIINMNKTVYTYQQNSKWNNHSLWLLGEPKVLTSLMTEEHILVFAHFYKALFFWVWSNFYLSHWDSFDFFQTGVNQTQKTDEDM